MPAYLNGPFNPPVTTLERGKPGYFFGSFNDLSAPSVMQITAAAQSANVATLTVTLLSGDPPAAGTGVYVQGSLAGEGSPPYGYNGGPYTLSTVNFTSGSPPITGVHGIITFPFTTSHNSGTLPDVGLAVVPTPVLAEVVTTNEVGKQFGLPRHLSVAAAAILFRGATTSRTRLRRPPRHICRGPMLTWTRNIPRWTPVRAPRARHVLRFLRAASPASTTSASRRCLRPSTEAMSSTSSHASRHNRNVA